jgi:hypothetical protein
LGFSSKGFPSRQKNPWEIQMKPSKKLESLLTAKYARKLLKYNPETGKLFWRIRTPDMFENGVKQSAWQKCQSWNGRFGGKKVAGKLKYFGTGYYAQICILLDGKERHFMLHRLCWLIHHKVWPKQQVDHINGDTSDNRIINLRDGATASGQAQNRKIPTTNKSGYIGVTGSDRHGWYASIMINNKTTALGTYKTAEEAAQAYLKAKAKMHSFQPIPRQAKRIIRIRRIP